MRHRARFVNIRNLLLRTFALLAIASSMNLIVGCNVVGYALSPLRDAEKTTNIKAAYTGLNDQRVAILVDADEYTLFAHPHSQRLVAEAVGRELRNHLPGVSVSDPAQIEQFQRRNPAWISVPYRDLFSQLDVDRLIFIELVEYRMHEPGNRYVWQGVIVGNVGVAEQDASNPDQLAFLTTVSTKYPPDRPLPMLEADEQTMELATLKSFSIDVGNLFHDYKKTEKPLE